LGASARLRGPLELVLRRRVTFTVLFGWSDIGGTPLKIAVRGQLSAKKWVAGVKLASREAYLCSAEQATFSLFCGAIA
jgi:hypothetical protein